MTTGTVKSVLRNGLSMDEDGEVRFYEDGEPIYAGLIYVDGYYYYINSSLKAVRDTTHWVSTTNGLMEEGLYTFDAQGRMTDPPADAVAPMVMRASDIVGYDIEFTQNKVQDYDYFYAGTQLIQLSVTTTVAEGTSTSQTLYFNYDASGSPMAVTYNGNTYYYASNLQGDIIAILDTDGDAAVEYTYDAWGNILTTTGDLADSLGEINPLRYRGYVYDTESGLYYLQSRYYDPEMGRFINADSYTSTGQGVLGSNMFAYCLNNPVTRLDKGGYISEEAADELIEEKSEQIKAAGEEFGVDPVAIAICIYAEQVQNVDWKDTCFDIICYWMDTSIGLGQVKVSTAIMLEDAGYLEETEAFYVNDLYITRQQIVTGKLMNDDYNIRVVAAYLKYWQDTWGDTYDISDLPAILATLYNLGTNANAPNKNPKPNPFGQYAAEKYEHVATLVK